jgi:K+-transporting ATPase KdpF subunit
MDTKQHKAAQSESLRFLYAQPGLCQSNLYAPCSENNCMRYSASFGADQMSILDGLSLAMAAGLFIYLLVALLRAERS